MTATAVVIVNFNTREHLRSCLASVRLERPDRIIVVDNGSSDGSAEMVRAEHPEVELLANGWNAGYGGAANHAFQECTEPYVLLLNADTILRVGALRVLTEYLDSHDAAAIVGPRLCNPDGTLQRSARPFPKLLTLRPVFQHIPGVREHYLPTWSHSRARVVPYVVGAALAIRRSAFEAVGGFDPEFFLFYEEVDLCRRLRLAGWEVHFAPVTTVVHARGASTRWEPGTSYVHRAISERRFYLRRYSGRGTRLVVTMLNVQVAARLVRDVVHRLLARNPTRRLQIDRRIAVHIRLLSRDWDSRPADAAAHAGAEAGVLN